MRIGHFCGWVHVTWIWNMVEFHPILMKWEWWWLNYIFYWQILSINDKLNIDRWNSFIVNGRWIIVNEIHPWHKLFDYYMRYFMLFEYYFKFIMDVLWSMLGLMDVNCDISLHEGNKELRVGRNKKKVKQFCYLVNKPFTASFDSLLWVKSWLYVEFELNNATFNIIYEEWI